MRLPRCEYPTSGEHHRLGLQPLPDDLPVADLASARRYRSTQYRVTKAIDLTPAEQLEMAEIIGDSFARRDPMLRFQQLPQPSPLPAGHRHIDPLGTHHFGAWQADNLFKWFIRIFFLTDPSTPLSSIRLRTEVLDQSLAILDAEGRAIGGVINETMPHGEPPTLRESDPVPVAILASFEAILEMLGEQERESVAALEQRYAGFRESLYHGKVGHLALIARADRLPTEDTSSVARYGCRCRQPSDFPLVPFGKNSAGLIARKKLPHPWGIAIASSVWLDSPQRAATLSHQSRYALPRRPAPPRHRTIGGHRVVRWGLANQG